MCITESNTFLDIHGVKIYQFKAKNFEIKPYPLYLGNTLKDSIVVN